MKTVYRFMVDGKPLSEGDAKKWLEANGYGINFANQEETAERAADAVNNMIRASEEAKIALLKPWEDIEWMMRGNALSVGDSWQSDIHVPETKKCLYAMAPRIVQALAGPGSELFHVVGRDEQDRNRALLIEELLRYQASLSKFSSNLERMVLCGLQYGIVAIGTGWKIKHRLQTVTEARQQVGKDGSVQMVIDVKPDTPVLAYEGFQWHLIEPRDLIWDPSATPGVEPEYAGENMRVPMHELLAMEAQGLVTGVVDAIEGKRPSTAKGILANEVDRMQHEMAKAERDGRSLRPEELWGRRTVSAADINRVPIRNLWATWSHKERPVESSDWRAWQFMYVCDAPVRIAHNPYRSQHIPIACTQLTREPFSPWAISMAMDALPLQIPFDQTRALGQRSHELSVSPFWSADEGVDVPRSLSSMLPGERLTGQNVEIHKWPSTITETIAATDMFRRDIREITGVPEGFTGSDQSGTATQYEGNITEANRRAQMFIYNMGDLVRTVFQHAFCYSSQFMTEARKFRVLGRGAQTLGFEAEIKPEDLVDPVDIEIVGLREFASHGLRATRLATFNAQFAPYINAGIQAGRIDPVALVEEGWLSTMGFRIGDKILRREMDPREVMTPQAEEVMLAQGQEVDIHPLDDHAEHAKVHLAGYAKAKEEDRPDSELSERFLHIQKHAAAYMQKQQEQQAQMQAQQLAQAQTPMLPNDGRKEAGDGRYHQTEPDVGQGPATTAPGEAPGPMRPAAMAAPDRTQPVFSTAQ